MQTSSSSDPVSAGPAAGHEPPVESAVARPATGTTAGLDGPERERYARHLLLPGVGTQGQLRLRGARVLVVGAGGLGSPVLTYLAAAGVGTLGVVDDDRVDPSNLQRQVLHGTPDIGRPKVDSARDRIAALNPHVRVETHPARLTAHVAEQLLRSYDVVVDATDNFPTRYLLADAAVLTGTPLVWGAISRFDGQVSVWWPGRGPCYRCVFPEPPAPGLVPSCAEGGVLGVLPGVVGTLQATEVIKILLDIGEPLVGRMLVYDALTATVETLPLRRHPRCPLCSADARPVTLTDLAAGCTHPTDPERRTERTPTAPTDGDRSRTAGEIDPQTAATWLTGGHPPLVVDVREAAEREIVRLPVDEELWIPLGDLHRDARLPGIDHDREILVYCRSGMRSAEALTLLRDAGYHRATHLSGGILRWRAQIDPGLPGY
ncbi:adenylyltransferase and sulfurtransferase [Austwickia chelonae]|uniref:Molybdopterin synthase sulfurylase MoeB n=1 Tax=Austwickia chelonae NBRC 105200 TaxID=1184607 RepID=K6V7S9_9MICO|nr:molybdopterin-synthase adenylyltransferase MoeB [Austwickia chelonae]GAB78283.1 molybdopterin synthase sulfurylase MoeB [Austwickia chelonae NBRC 105200]SEW00403.1 adenylyltransferase and sulfurtransferase [Austwickia chelonae]